MPFPFVGEPGINEHCGYKIFLGNGWRGRNCSAQLPFYCVDEPLILVKEQKTWEEALEHCRALTVFDPVHRYDLASPLTSYDHVYVREMLQETVVDKVRAFTRMLHISSLSRSLSV